VDAAVDFAEESPFPAAGSLYDDVYVLGERAAGREHGWYSVRTVEHGAGDGGAPGPNSTGEIPQQITSALQAGEDALQVSEAAAHAGDGARERAGDGGGG
jgi:hypothetical protein